MNLDLSNPVRGSAGGSLQGESPRCLSSDRTHNLSEREITGATGYHNPPRGHGVDRQYAGWFASHG